MGLFSFLFTTNRTLNLTIELPEHQYEALMALFKAVKAKDDTFTEDKFFSHLVSDWLEKNWGNSVNKMARMGKEKQTRKRKN